MTLELPSNIESGRSPEWVALHLAIGLYVSGEVTLGQAAQVAHLTQQALLRELHKRKIPMNYSAEDLKVDLAAVRELASR